MLVGVHASVVIINLPIAVAVYRDFYSSLIYHDIQFSVQKIKIEIHLKLQYTIGNNLLFTGVI